MAQTNGDTSVLPS